MTRTIKNDGIASIVNGLSRTSRWRERTAQLYAHDCRNASAAARLAALATEAEEMTESQWAALQPHFGWANERWIATVSLAARQVGFHRPTPDFDAFVRHLADLLSLETAPV
jgi:hypothetical protein